MLEATNIPSKQNMADTDNFPFPTDNGGGEAIDPNIEGASGKSTGGVSLSHGALIAIIVVVVVVALAGSKNLLT